MNNPFEPPHKSFTSLTGRTKSRLHRYRRSHLALFQWRLLVTATLCSAHYAISTFAWVSFIFFYQATLFRSSQTRFWSELSDWIPFYLRIWKAVLPLCFSMLAMYLVPDRPKHTFLLIAFVVTFSVACAWHDISHELFEMSYFGESSGVVYMTWWWYDPVMQRWYDFLRFVQTS
jgi:hypothetical protein